MTVRSVDYPVQPGQDTMFRVIFYLDQYGNSLFGCIRGECFYVTCHSADNNES